MIRKILPREYLKGYGDMTAKERKAFLGRVGEWLARNGERLLTATDRPMARSQSLMTITARWTKEDIKALLDGITLMSALVAVADTWLPTQLYMKSAFRAVRQIMAVLSEIPQGTERKTDGASEGKQAKPAPAEKTSGKAEQTKKLLPMIKTVGKTYDAATNTVKVECAVVPARPRHIDQYVHLLPKATQERASKYGELMRQLDEAREKMRLLVDDPHAPAKSREQWAKTATKIDKEIRDIRAELDCEWEKLAQSGRVVVDDLGVAHVVPGENLDGKTAEHTTTSELTSEQRKRRRDLRKWMIDLRRGKEGKDREKRIEQWRVNWQEYLTLEPRELALQDEKILEAAKHFGVELDGTVAEHETKETI